MTIDCNIRDEKLEHDINRKPALSSGEIHKYEYLTDKEILPFNQAKSNYRSN